MKHGEKKIKVIGFDIDKKKIRKLNSSKSYINYYSNKDIQIMKRNGFECTSKFRKISKTDIIIMCLPTPLKKNLFLE